MRDEPPTDGTTRAHNAHGQGAERRRVPMFEAALMGIGTTLFAAGSEVLLWPIAIVPIPAETAVTLEAIPNPTPAAAVARSTRRQTRDQGVPRQAGKVKTPGEPSPRPLCLGTMVAIGKRAESMHLASVPIHHLDECGDSRDLLLGLATLKYCARPSDTGVAGVVAATAPATAAGDLDRTAAALYGPPDRQDQATLATQTPMKSTATTLCWRK